MSTSKKRRPRRAPSVPRLPADLVAGVTAALEKKAIDVAVLDLRPALAFTDFFVICSGANTRQVQAIAESVQAALASQGTKAAVIEGKGRGDWVLIDYFDFIFHIFTPATREFYGLERLWGDAERVEIPA